ncbi:MAG TPA: hypothetical protein VJH24_03430 [Candidatus Bilamarchaeaceae archaeon]|nr:hypothetical protein [Candidatus Bilamarchaeaceae archaeon]
MNTRELGFVMLVGILVIGVAVLAGWAALSPETALLLVAVLYLGLLFHWKWNVDGKQAVTTAGLAFVALVGMQGAGSALALLPFAIAWMAPPLLVQFRRKVFKKEE